MSTRDEEDLRLDDERRRDAGLEVSVHPKPEAVEDFSLVCYANQPVYRTPEGLVAPHRNFVDLLSRVVASDPGHRFVVPVLETTESIDGFVVDLPPSQVIEIPGYRGRVQALLATIRNFSVISRVCRQRSAAAPAVLVTTVPCSMLTALLLFGRNIDRFVGVARGDTRKTIHHILGNSIRGRIANFIVSRFLGVARAAQRRGRLRACGVGPEVLRSLELDRFDGVELYPLLHSSEMPRDRGSATRRPGPVRFLMLGRLSREKAVLEALDAARRLAAEGVPFELTIAGFGPMQGEIEGVIADLDSGNVRFIGAVAPGPAVYELILENDVLLLPSRTEGVPRTVAEATAARRLVLATPVGSIPGTFGDSVRYLDDSSPESIMDGMRWAVEHQSAWSAHVEKAAEVAEGLTIDAASEKLVSFVRGWMSETRDA